jgi:VCBS repeat-containing protein
MTTENFGNGDQTITAGSNLTINVGNGDDKITIGSNDVLKVGNGDDKITAGSNDQITVGNGDDKITIGSNDVLKVGNGDDKITAGSNDQITAGNGDDTITAGDNSTVKVGNGDDTVTVGANSSITAGNGDNELTAGNNSTITSGNGENIVVAGANNQVTVGNGDATIFMHANDTVHVGHGSDKFIFETPKTPTLVAPASLTVNEDGSIALPITVGLSQFGFGQDQIFGFLAGHGDHHDGDHEHHGEDGGEGHSHDDHGDARDKLVFFKSQFASFADVIAHATQVGPNTVITGDAADTITLVNTKLSSLTDDNFRFLNAVSDPISVTISGIPSDATLSDSGGPLTVVGGSITLTPAQLAGLTLKGGEETTAILAVTVTDTVSGNSVSQTIALTVLPAPLVVNPVTTDVFATSFAENGLIVAGGNAITDVGDSSDDGELALGVTAVNGSAANVGTLVAGTYGSLFIDSSGSYFYRADAIDQLQQGNNPTDQFAITVTDQNGHSQSTTVTFDIHGANKNPVITSANAFGSIFEGLGPNAVVNGGFETGDLTGWSTIGPDISVQPLFLGGQFGNFSALLGPTTGPDETLTQLVPTVAGQQYILDFFVAGDIEASANALTVSWNGSPVVALSNVVSGGFTEFTFDVTGAAGSTALSFSYHDNGVGMFLDQVSASPTTAPGSESTAGSVAFSDINTGDTHTASFVPQQAGDVGTFSLDPVSESAGSGSVAWHFTVNNADLGFLTPGQTLTQDYLVTIADNHGGTAVQDVTVAIHDIGTQSLTVNAGTTVELPSAYSGSVTFASSTGTLQLDTSTSFTGTVSGMTGQDTLDLRDINPATVQTPTFTGDASGGTLHVTDGTRTANISLLGNYLSSTFVASDDSQGGTSVVDPPSGAAGGPSIPSVALLANHMASAFAAGGVSPGTIQLDASVHAQPIPLTPPQHG